MTTRVERDPLGELHVPADAYYGVQTQRAAENFPISGLKAPAPLVTATVLIKQACARANAALGRLDPAIADAIVQAADEILAGKLRDQFIVAGMKLVHPAHVAFNKMALGRAKGSAADMRNKYSRHGDMAPAKMPRSDAEVVLLTIALREDVLAQHSRDIQAVTLDVDAEPHRARNIHHPPGVCRMAERVQPRRLGQVGNCVIVLDTGIAQDGCVIRQRGRRADARCRIGRFAQAF